MCRFGIAGRVVIGTAVGLLLGSGEGLAAVTAGTARTHLDEARRMAARWQKDAALVTVSALRAAEDGTAPLNSTGWVYTFHSRGAKKWAGFHSTPTGLERVDLPAGLTEPLPAAFVDSDRVLAEVRRHGFTRKGDTLVVLTRQQDPNLKPGIYWCVASQADLSVERGMRGYCVDPATGRFVARMAGQPTSPPPAASASSASPRAGAAGGVIAGLDPEQCGGFSATDAAAILGVSTGNLTRRVERGSGSDWTCSYASAKGGAQVAFSVSVAKSAAEAAAEMERYRRSLGDDYSDLMGMGDEGVWTEASKTVTCRKKNVTVKVRQPPEKIPQLRIVKALFDKN